MASVSHGLAVGLPNQIGPNSELDNVFAYFYAKLPSPSNSPRSICEAVFPSSDIDALTAWFSDLYKKPRMWCDDPWQGKVDGVGYISNQEMFGALLIILSSEVCRHHSSEEDLWPAVTSVLEKDRLSFPLLFDSNRQPNTLCKKAMAEGARRLKLRNLIDCSGRQEYVDTIRLQFGFTIRGARKRLPDWLAGLGRPVAVKILCGEEPGFEHLRSASFIKLWTALGKLRRRRADIEYVSSVLQSSPWIGRGWATEILALTLSETVSNRIDVPSAASWPRPDSVSESACDLLLHWDTGSKPRFRLVLNEDRIYEILGRSRKAQFAVEGLTVGTWTALEGGGWHGERDLPCEPRLASTNLRPHMLTISADSQLLEEIDLGEFGTSEPLSVYDLATGAAINLQSRLNLNRDYAFVCDTDLTIPGATQVKAKGRTAFRVTGPWPSDLRVICDGLTYWRPTLTEAESNPNVTVELESAGGEFAEPGSLLTLKVSGIPDYAKLVRLTVNSVFYEVVRKASGWETQNPVNITGRMALGTEKLRIRIEGHRVLVPKVGVKFRGIAFMESPAGEDSELRWEFLNRKRPLDRASGAGNAKFFVELQSPWLYEGACRIARLGNRSVPLRTFQAWGAPLIVRDDNGRQVPLLDSVEDRGAGCFQPPMLRNEPAIHWRAPVCPGREHRIYLWGDLLREPQVIEPHEITSRRGGLTWRFAGPVSVAAMAVAYQGARHVAFWSDDGILRALRDAPSAKLFALLRWLHVPVLRGSFREAMERAVKRCPAEFLSGWLQNDLAGGMASQPGEMGLQTVIRELLWNHTERSESTMDRIAELLRPVSLEGAQCTGIEGFRNALLSLGLRCPSLAYGYAVKKLRGDKYKKAVRNAAASMIQMAEIATPEQLRNQLAYARRENARLIGISEAGLEAAESAFAAHLETPDHGYRQYEPALRRLGETSRGPQFLTASLLLRLTDRRQF